MAIVYNLKTKRMQKILSLLILLLSSLSTFGQTFKGHSVNGYYNCLFQINSDSTITYIYDRDNNGVYAEYIGYIRKLNDSTYSVKAKLAIGQYYMKSFNKDTLYIQLDPKIAQTLDVIEVEYSNKKIRKQFQGYDNKGTPIRLLKFPVNKDLFNQNEGTDFVTITVNRKNRITGDWVSFRIPYGSAASIKNGDKIEFKVVIKKEKLRSIGNKLMQTGHIKLKKK
jgi:hypothetical protein